jgi:hypothetical protein
VFNRAIARSLASTFYTLGLAVGEIPTLSTQGTLWRTQLLYSLLSEYEIFHLRLFHAFDVLSRCLCRCRKASSSRLQPILTLQINSLEGPLGRRWGLIWDYFNRNFVRAAIQDMIPLSKQKTDNTQTLEDPTKVFNL